MILMSSMQVLGSREIMIINHTDFYYSHFLVARWTANPRRLNATTTLSPAHSYSFTNREHNMRERIERIQAPLPMRPLVQLSRIKLASWLSKFPNIELDMKGRSLFVEKRHFDSSKPRVVSPLGIDHGRHRLSGSGILRNPMDFPDKTGLHVDNKTPHRNFFGDPWM